MSDINKTLKMLLEVPTAVDEKMSIVWQPFSGVACESLRFTRTELQNMARLWSMKGEIETFIQTVQTELGDDNGHAEDCYLCTDCREPILGPATAVLDKLKKLEADA
mgnify:FL=1